MNSIHKSIRSLLSLGLSRSDSASPQTITRTVKFKINMDAKPEILSVLHGHFDAFEKFRRIVLGELETWWSRDPADFTRAIRCSAKEPYDGKKRAFGVLSTRFVTGRSLPDGLMNKGAQALVDSLGSNMKSFLSRRESVAEDIQKRFHDNLDEWNNGLRDLAQEKSVDLPPHPPTLDFNNLTAEAIEHYNDWVGRTRAWCNLILVQQKKVDRREA